MVFQLSCMQEAAAAALDWSKIEALPAKMGYEEGYPMVIIGAGLGGLCCGALRYSRHGAL